MQTLQLQLSYKQIILKLRISQSTYKELKQWHGIGLSIKINKEENYFLILSQQIKNCLPYYQQFL